MRSAVARNTIFGVEDGLISTVGLLSGIAIAGVPQSTILLTGVVLILVEAFSMGVGSFSSEREGMEMDAHREVSVKQPLKLAGVMFLSYFLAGFIPLFPYLIWDAGEAVGLSILISLLALFLLGFVGGRVAKINPWRKGLQMLVIGGIAIFLGMLAGRIIQEPTSSSIPSQIYF